MRLFDIDNPVMRAIIKVFDCVALSVLWLVFSLPVVTCGAASAALYTACRSCLRRGEGYVWRTFWEAFRENFKRSTVLWLIVLAVQALLLLDVWVCRTFAASAVQMTVLYYFVLALFCASMVWAAFLTAYSALFTGSVKEVLKFSLLLPALHPLRSLGVLAVILAELALCLAAPALALLLPAAASLACGFPIENIFLLHMSEEDVNKIVHKEDSP